MRKQEEALFSLEVEHFPFSIGASPLCDVVLDDPGVSRNHALVALSRGKLVYTDQSTNGSFFNGQRISEQTLQAGDVMLVPPFELRFDYVFEDEGDRMTTMRPLSEMIPPEPDRAAGPGTADDTCGPEPAPRPPAPESTPPPPSPQPTPPPTPAGAPVHEEPSTEQASRMARPPSPQPSRPSPPLETPAGPAAAMPAQVPASTPAPRAQAPEPPPVEPPLATTGPAQLEGDGSPILRVEPPVVFERAAEPGVIQPPAPPPSVGENGHPSSGIEDPESHESTAVLPVDRLAGPPEAPAADRAAAPRRDAAPVSGPGHRAEHPPTSAMPRATTPPPRASPSREPAPTRAHTPDSAAIQTGAIQVSAAAKPPPTGHGPPDSTVCVSVDALMHEPHAWLTVVDGPPELRGQTYPLPAQAITLGRGDRADFQFELGNISRVHTKLAPHSKDEWILRDLSSLNGTYIGDRRITEASLRLEQEFRLANSIVFRLTRAPAEAAPKKLKPEPTKPHDLDDRGAKQAQPVAPRQGRPAVEQARPTPPRQRVPPSRQAAPAARQPPPAPTASPPPPAAEAPGTGTVLKDVIISTEHRGEDGSILVVRIRGRLDAYNYTELGEILQQAIDTGERSILLDLSQLGFVDHTGLGVLVRTTTRLDKMRGQVRLVGVRKKLQEAFSLSRLDVIFHDRIATDEASAIADMSHGQGGRFFRNPFKK